MFWSQWSGNYWNADLVNWLAQDFQVTLIRCAMGVEEGGYLSNPAAEKAKLETVVNASTLLVIKTLLMQKIPSEFAENRIMFCCIVYGGRDSMDMSSIPGSFLTVFDVHSSQLNGHCLQLLLAESEQSMRRVHSMCENDSISKL